VTARVFEAVRAARPARLFVVADGPRSGRPAEPELCEQARGLVADVDWPCEVARLYANENLGCGRRVSSGLDWVFDAVPEAIVLEDDCLPQPSFFAFCEALLALHRDDERVTMIGGTNYFPDAAREESYFFSRYFPVWGWAAWARAWRSYDYEMRTWPTVRAQNGLEAYYSSAGLARWMSDAFDAVQRGEVDTWDFQWVHACVAENGLCATPRVNLVTNIGFEGTRALGDGVGMPSEELDVEKLVGPATFIPDGGYEHRLFEERLRSSRRDVFKQQALGGLSRARRAIGARASTR
jgi:hypothetical protein